MKERVLHFIMVLVLVLCMTLPMVTPAMASDIWGTKQTIPAFPNMYRVGDTIHYVMTVGNSGNNTATNNLSRIWDTLPNGAVIEFLYEGSPYGTELIQTPGQNATFYLDYVVDWDDAEYNASLGYWIVKNTFEAEGSDSNGDGVTVRVNKNSRIIQPDIDIEKYVWDGAGWQDADTTTGPYLPSTQDPVVFKFEIDNTGDVELTSVNLTDTDMLAFYTDQACTSPASFPTTLAVNETKTYYGQLPWAAGQHSNNATVTGAPPVGDPVSDSDPAHYFGSGASIDLEKHVWDGATWHDADTPTGPSLTSAQNPVVFRFVITNNDNVNLTNVTLTDTDISAFYTDQACTSPATFPIATLATNTSATVYGKLAWAPGQHSNNATATGTPPVGAPISDSDPAHYFGPGPSIDVEKHVWDGATWHDADAPAGPSLTSVQNPVVFRFVITNNGNVDLTSVNLTDTDMSAFYIDEGCTTSASFPTTLAVNETKTYYGKLPWAQGQHTDTATATGSPPVGAPVSDTDSANYFGPPPSIDVEKHVWDGATWHDADTPTGPSLTSAQNPVVFRFVIINNGSVNLTNVTLSDTDMSAFYTDQGLTIPATLPILTLALSASQTFYGSLPWAEGQHGNTATATGTPPVGGPISDSDPAHYFGRNVTLPVGWETYPINKVRVLLPWITLLVAIIVGASLLVLRHRRAQS